MNKEKLPTCKECAEWQKFGEMQFCGKAYDGEPFRRVTADTVACSKFEPAEVAEKKGEKLCLKEKKI